MILQAREDVGEPGLRVNVVELGGAEQRVDRGGTAAAFANRLRSKAGFVGQTLRWTRRAFARPAVRSPARTQARANLKLAASCQFLIRLDKIVMRRNDVPGRSGIEADIAAGNEIQSVHQPHRRRAVGVLPLDIGLAVAVEVSRGVDLP
jgi:hypothetical protein